MHKLVNGLLTATVIGLFGVLMGYAGLMSIQVDNPLEEPVNVPECDGVCECDGLDVECPNLYDHSDPETGELWTYTNDLSRAVHVLVEGMRDGACSQDEADFLLMGG